MIPVITLSVVILAFYFIYIFFCMISFYCRHLLYVYLLISLFYVKCFEMLLLKVLYKIKFIIIIIIIKYTTEFLRGKNFS